MQKRREEGRKEGRNGGIKEKTERGRTAEGRNATII